MGDRTKADEFDCDLYNLIMRADRLAESGSPKERRAWKAIGDALSRTRPTIRTMMTEKERQLACN